MIDVVELSQAVVLGILQNSNSVPLGAEIWSSPQEFKKLKTIIEYAVAYSNKQKELTDDEILESLAELEHEQWVKWADTIMQTEKISDSRFARWASCMIPYAELSEEMKEHDRVWARQALAILRKANKK